MTAVATSVEQETVQENGDVQSTNEDQSQQPGNAVMLAPPDDNATGSIDVFASHEKFRAAQRMAMALAKSTIVPGAYRNQVANCLIAMEIAARTNASVIMVMQNLYLVDGKPGWSASFLVASVNTSGRFSNLRYETDGGNDPALPSYRVRAYATEKATGDTLYGEWISWAMVKAEGWYDKKGSKWRTMPGQMFRYRAAAFWVRSYCPEIALGMRTMEEYQDISESGPSAGAASLNDAIRQVSTPPAAPKNESVAEVEVMTEAPKPTKSAAEIDEEIRREDLELLQQESKPKK